MEQTKDELTHRRSERHYRYHPVVAYQLFYCMTALGYLYICTELSYPYLVALKFF